MYHKRIIFLTEGGLKIGFGHLTRCIALYQAFLEKGFLSTFIVHGDDSVINVLHDVPFLRKNWLNGIECIKSTIENSIIIVDTFSISDKLLIQLSDISKITILDDFIRRDHHNKLVIDWTINTENKFYIHKNPTSRYLLGHKFIALRHPFWNCPKYFVKPKIENVLITLGSGDIRNLIPHISNMLQKNNPAVMKTIIVGSSNQNKKTIEDLIDNKTTIIFDANADEMRINMMKADIAIASGGQTLYELACVGLPTISIMLIDNQLDDINGWHGVGFTKHAGAWNDIDLHNNILSCFESLETIDTRQEISKIGQQLVDGQGARRIIEMILEELYDY